MNMKMVLKSWKFWVVMVAGSVLSVFLALGIIYNTYANIKLSTPANLNVITLSNGEVYAEVDANNKAINYEFIIWTSSNNIKKYISQTNILDISNIIKTPSNYQIKCRVLGRTENSNSNYCRAIEFSSAVKIAQPTIMLKPDDNTILLFSLNDDFSQSVTLGFELYYKANSATEFLKHTTFFITGGTSNGVSQGYFNLTFLNDVGAGEYSLGVKAVSPSNEFYLESDLSSQLVYIVE
ncbi:MAG: hypothetical protein PHQ62_03950 [Clostridia bacterium]|nr:hypothetical protein [Clostridia bacterium]